MQVYGAVVTIRINKVERTGSPQGMQDRLLQSTVTEAAAEGATPLEAYEGAVKNGAGDFVAGLTAVERPGPKLMQ